MLGLVGVLSRAMVSFTALSHSSGEYILCTMLYTKFVRAEPIRSAVPHGNDNTCRDRPQSTKTVQPL